MIFPATFVLLIAAGQSMLFGGDDQRQRAHRWPGRRDTCLTVLQPGQMEHFPLELKEMLRKPIHMLFGVGTEELHT